METHRAIGILLAVIPGIAAAGPRERPGEGAKIVREIRIINLVIGLELEKDQADLILKNAREARKLEAEFESTIENEGQAHLDMLRELRDIRMRGREVPPDLKKRVHRGTERVHALEREHDTAVSALASEVVSALRGDQLYAIEHYKPCLVPPEGAGRIGQADDPKGGVERLERLRNMPAEAFLRKKDRIAREVVERLRRHVPKGYIMDDEAEAKRVLAVFDEARRMSDAEFAVGKEGLVERIKARFTLPNPPIDISIKVERFLLDPAVIPVLEERWRAGR
ncbi:MAG: hypothetical protein HY897_21020 [Deltaproteobacteria bacterium]|nr:hypothetical protein [Deltaproteobacteria bacterium]